MESQEQREQKERSNRRWNIITFVAFLAFAPAGAALLVARLLDLLPNIGGEINIGDIKPRASTVYKPEVWQKQTQPESKIKQAAESTAIAKKELKGMPTGNASITFFGIITALMGAGFGLNKLVDLIDHSDFFAGMVWTYTVMTVWELLTKQ